MATHTGFDHIAPPELARGRRSGGAGEIARAERVLFAVICVAALFVAWLGLFAPLRMDESFTWALLPPLHARFVGVLYLFGGVYMAGCLVARYRSQVAPALPAIGIFTSVLMLVTLLNLDAFDLGLGPVRVWTISYVVYPTAACALAWRYRHRRSSAGGSPLAPMARAFLFAQALGFGALGVGLLAAREAMVSVWPWPMSDGLAQFYAGPFLAYAVCSISYARCRTWTEVAPVVPAMLTFTLGTLVVSVMHRTLFSAGDPAAWVWFVAFLAATMALSMMAVRGLHVRRGADRAVSR